MMSLNKLQKLKAVILVIFIFNLKIDLIDLQLEYRNIPCCTYVPLIGL